MKEPEPIEIALEVPIMEADDLGRRAAVLGYAVAAIASNIPAWAERLNAQAAEVGVALGKLRAMLDEAAEERPL